MDNDWTWLKLPHLMSITLEKGMWKTINDMKTRHKFAPSRGTNLNTHTHAPSSFSFSSVSLPTLELMQTWMHVWTFAYLMIFFQEDFR